jgi:hypothetical protein
MMIADILIETLPGQAYRVARRMSGLWLSENETAEGLSEAIQAMDADILALDQGLGVRSAA